MTGVGVPEAVAASIVIASVLALGGWCRFQINGRRFRRRTIGGGQQFPSYTSAVFTQLWERLLMSFATLLMIGAILCGLGLAMWMVKYG